MSILPEGDLLRKAIQWISDEMECRPNVKRNKLIEEACVRFDLSPSDSEFILRFYQKEKTAQG